MIGVFCSCGGFAISVVDCDDDHDESYESHERGHTLTMLFLLLLFFLTLVRLLSSQLLTTGRVVVV